MPSNDDLQSSTRPATLLFVDDEPNILNALRRLFRPLGYKIHTAEGGSEGLALLEQEPVDLVISDMRMPEMNGAQFLEKVRQKWPDAIRILLTGYADVSSTIDAINRGAIYKFLTKPWDGDLLRANIQGTFQRYELAQDSQRLSDEMASINEELNRAKRELERGRRRLNVHHLVSRIAPARLLSNKIMD